SGVDAEIDGDAKRTEWLAMDALLEAAAPGTTVVSPPAAVFLQRRFRLEPLDSSPVGRVAGYTMARADGLPAAPDALPPPLAVPRGPGRCGPGGPRPGGRHRRGRRHGQVTAPRSISPQREGRIGDVPPGTLSLLREQHALPARRRDPAAGLPAARDRHPRHGG